MWLYMGGYKSLQTLISQCSPPPGPALAGVVQDAFLSPMISGPAQQCKMYGPKCSTKIAKTRKVLNTDAGEKQLLVK